MKKYKNDQDPLFKGLGLQLKVPRISCEMKEEEFFVPNYVISIRSLLQELNLSDITNNQRFSQIFSLLNGDVTEQSATFLLSIFDTNYLHYKFFIGLDMYQKERIFTSFAHVFQASGVEFSRIVEFLDQENQNNISILGIHAVLSAICFFCEKQLLPTSFFLSKWKNAKLHREFLLVLATYQFRSIDFSKNINVFRINGFDVKPKGFSYCNNCWISIDFCSMFFHYYRDDATVLSQVLSPVVSQSPSFLLYIVSQSFDSYNETILNIASSSVLKILSYPNPNQIINNLWSSSCSLLSRVFSITLSMYPIKSGLIVAAYESHLLSLITKEPPESALRISLNSEELHFFSFKEMIIEYLTNYMKKDYPLFFVSFTKLLKEGNFTTDHVNCIFKYFEDNQSVIPIESLCLAVLTFKSSKLLRPNIENRVFSVNISSEIYEMNKRNIQKLIYEFFNEQVSLSNIIEYLLKKRFENIIFFSQFRKFLLLELSFICSYTNKHAQLIAQLFSAMINNHLFENSQIGVILSFIQGTYEKDYNEPVLHFCDTLLQLSIHTFSSIPEFVTSVINHSSFVETYPRALVLLKELHEKSINRCIDYDIELLLHPSLRRFLALHSPPERLFCIFDNIFDDPSKIPLFISKYSTYIDWIAFEMVLIIQNRERLIKSIVDNFPKSRVLLEAAICQSLRIIKSHLIDTIEGDLNRHKLIVLGRLIGELTISSNRVLLNKFLDLKKLIFYAFIHGKLYSVVPFVVSIFYRPSSIFLTPNPYTISILRVLSMVNRTESLKNSIKNSIQGLFSLYNVRCEEFSSIIKPFPKKTIDNFDYVLQPFSLKSMLNEQNIEKLVNFQEQYFLEFVNSLIQIPNTNGLSFPLYSTKNAICNFAFSLIKKESPHIASTAADTATVLVTKDFSEYGPDMIQASISTIKALTHSLSEYAATKVGQLLHLIICKECKNGDYEWCDIVAQKNYQWIVQLLRDISEYKALSMISKTINLNYQKSNAVVSDAVKNAYQILSDVQLGIHPFSLFECRQNRENDIEKNLKFEQFLNLFSTTQEGKVLNPPEEVMGLYPNLPVIVEQSRFQSILKTILRFAVMKAPGILDEEISMVLEMFSKGVSKNLIDSASSTIIFWIRGPLHSPIIIATLLRLGFVGSEALSQLFEEQINEAPVNPKTILHVIRILSYLLLENTIFVPESFISSLFAVYCIHSSHLESFSIDNISEFLLIHRKLSNLYLSLDTSQADIRQTIDTEYPVIPPSSLFVPDYESILSKSISEGILEDQIESIFHGNSAFLFFELFNSKYYPKSLLWFHDILPKIDIHHCLLSFFNSFHFILKINTKNRIDWRQQFSFFDSLINYCLINNHCMSTCVEYVLKLNPLAFPSFAFCWFTTVFAQSFIKVILSNSDLWGNYSMIIKVSLDSLDLIDRGYFIDTYNTIYKTILRFLLILYHDNQAYLSFLAGSIGKQISPSFYQVRNILFSSNRTCVTIVQQDQDFFKKLDIVRLSIPNHSNAFYTLFNEIEKKVTPNDPKIVQFIDFLSLPMCHQFSSQLLEMSLYRNLIVPVISSLLDELRTNDDQTAFVLSLFENLLNANKIASTNVSIPDIIGFLLCQRCQTPPPYPWGIKMLFSRLFISDSCFFPVFKEDNAFKNKFHEIICCIK